MASKTFLTIPQSPSRKQIVRGRSKKFAAVGKKRVLLLSSSKGRAAKALRTYLSSSGTGLSDDRETIGAVDPVVDAYLPDARARAILRGVLSAREVLKDAGGAFALDEVRTLLGGISRQAVSKRVADGSLVAVPGPNGGRVYPTVQFNPGGTIVEGLKAVQEALPTRNAWTVLSFLAEPDERLGGTAPIEVLRQGHVDRVIEAARRYGEQGA